MKKEKFESLVETYLKSKEKELIEQIYIGARECVDIWMHTQLRFKHDEFPSNFQDEVALEFISRVYENRMTNKPYYVLLSIARLLSRKFIYTSSSDVLESQSVVSKGSDDRLLFEEYVQQEIKGLSKVMQGLLFYLLVYPEEFQNVYKLHSSTPEFYICIVKLSRIRNEFLFRDSNFNLIVPDTQASRVLFLSSLYKHSPALLVLFLLFKDVAKFVQFCLFFGGETVKVPDISTLMEMMDNKSLAGEESIDDLLQVFSVEGKENIEGTVKGVTTILQIYLQKSIGELVDNYNKFQKKLVEGVDVCNSRDIEKVYKVLRKELGSQLLILKRVLGG